MAFVLRVEFLVALAVGVTGCGWGPVRCDEPDNSCFTAPPGPSVTLHQLRQQARGAYSADAGVPLQNVVVTAFNSCASGCVGGHVGDTWLQETSPLSATNCPLLPDGTARACAIQVFQPSFSPTGFHPSIGDVVNTSGGGYQEFQCATCGHPPSPFPDPYFVPEIAKPTVISAGVTPPPPPIPVTMDDLQNNTTLYMGVLVTLQNVTAGGPPNTHGDIPIMGSNPANGLVIVEEMVPMASVVSGTHWDSITGIATYFYNPEIIPRMPSDLVNQH